MEDSAQETNLSSSLEGGGEVMVVERDPLGRYSRVSDALCPLSRSLRTHQRPQGAPARTPAPQISPLPPPPPPPSSSSSSCFSSSSSPPPPSPPPPPPLLLPLRVEGGDLTDAPLPTLAAPPPPPPSSQYNEILGRGAFKTVYKAFDDEEGIEVAWNQVRATDFVSSEKDAERLKFEVQMLRSLVHPCLMKFYDSWVDPKQLNINFITELFTSGTLRQ